MRAGSGFLTGVLVTLVVLVVAGLIFIYSGAYSVAASEPHTALGRWVLHTTMAQSIHARAEEIEPPDDLGSRQRIEAGAGDYDSMCVHCHLAPAMEPTAVHKGLLPQPPKLAEDKHEAAEVFWVAKHGIKMTGMPAWGETHDDDALWNIVAFVQQLPQLSAAEYETLVAGSESSHGAESGGQPGHSGTGEAEP